MVAEKHNLRRIFLAVSAAIALLTTSAAFSQGVPPPPSSTKKAPVVEAPKTSKLNTHMAESLRASIRKVVVVPGDSPAERAVAGDYKKGSLGGFDGMVSGADGQKNTICVRYFWPSALR